MNRTVTTAGQPLPDGPPYDVTVIGAACGRHRDRP